MFKNLCFLLERVPSSAHGPWHKQWPKPVQTIWGLLLWFQEMCHTPKQHWLWSRHRQQIQSHLALKQEILNVRKKRQKCQSVIPEIHVNSDNKYPSTDHSVCSQVEFHQITLSHMPPIRVQKHTVSHVITVDKKKWKTIIGFHFHMTWRAMHILKDVITLPWI